MSIIEKAINRLEPDSTQDLKLNRVSKQTLGVARSNGSRDKDLCVSGDNKSIQIHQFFQTYMIPASKKDRAKYKMEFSKIRRALQRNFNAFNTEPKKRTNFIIVSSSSSNEGKTFTALNIAYSLCKNESKNIVYIDADLERKEATKLLNLENKIGFMELLSDENLIAEDVLHRTDLSNFYVMPAGLKNRDSEVFYSCDLVTSKLNKLLSMRNTIVIMDSPPQLSVPEAQGLLKAAGQILLVAEANKTNPDMFAELVDIVDREKPVGIVFNKADSFQKGTMYGYEYGY